MLDDLVNALKATGLPFAEYAWSKAPQGDYGTYGAEGEHDLHAANRHAERATVVYVNYFTRTPSVLATIEEALEASGAAWYLNTEQFEAESGFLHAEWRCEI